MIMAAYRRKRRKFMISRDFVSALVKHPLRFHSMSNCDRLRIEMPDLTKRKDLSPLMGEWKDSPVDDRRAFALDSTLVLSSRFGCACSPWRRLLCPIGGHDFGNRFLCLWYPSSWWSKFSNPAGDRIWHIWNRVYGKAILSLDRSVPYNRRAVDNDGIDHEMRQTQMQGSPWLELRRYLLLDWMTQARQ